MGFMLILPDFRIHQRDYLLKISRAITAQLDLEVVLRMVLEASASMLGSEIGLIALRDLNNHLSIHAILGVEAEQAEVFDPLLEIANTPREALDQNEIQMRMRLISRKLDKNLRQVISLPMRISGEVLGIIFVFRPYPGTATPDDLQILQSFTDQAAIAVHNAGLYQATIAEKQRLSTILDASADGIMILDVHQRILRLNPALARMTGWQAEYGIGRRHDDVIRWAEPVPEYSLEKALEAGWPFTEHPDDFETDGSIASPANTFYVEGNLERLDGLRLSVEIKYAPVLFEDGTLRNIIANVRDITRFREAEEMKSTFISVMSHELKTPVALIKGYAGTLRREDAHWDANTIQRGLSVIEEEADRLTELIENLLMASRLQVEGIVQLNLGDVALDHIVSSAIERFALQNHTHELVNEFPSKFPVIIGDAKKLRNVIDNLISNAIKYSPNGSQIKVGGSYDENEVRVYVKDAGIGIAPEDLEPVFERFYRANNAIKNGAPGTGLGLYLVRAIIEAHHGQIWAMSTPQATGSTFTFTLPRA